MPIPTRRLALLLALTAPSWLLSGLGTVGVMLPVVCTVAVLAAAALDVVRAPTAGTITVERELPTTVGMGERATGAYTIRSHWPRTLRVRLHDRLPAALLPPAHTADTGNDVPLAPTGRRMLLPPGGTARLPLEVTGGARGAAELGPVALRVEGRWRLMDSLLRPEPSGAAGVAVAPSVAGVRRYRLLALQRRLRDAGVRQLRRRGEGTTFAGLRDYAVGDDPRHMDWKATARRGRPIVREFSVEQGQSVIVAVDAGRMMTQLAGDGRSRFEHALEASLVLADVAVSSGDRVGLLAFDDEVRAWIPPTRGVAALAAMRTALTPVQATLTEPDYATAFRTLATRHRRRSLLVLFTDVVDERSSQALLSLATRGAARHMLLVVALRNDALDAAALPTAGDDRGATYGAAAAEELLQARETALRRMRRAGVSVVDISPDRMVAAVVNRYLELKGRSAA